MMSNASDREWEQWLDAWRTDAGTPAAPEAVVDAMRRRGRLIASWFAGEVAIGLGFAVLLVHRAVTHTDPVEKLAMGLLALIAAGAVVASWLTWRDTLRASAETTAAYVALSLKRSARVRRWIAAGWVILVSEVVVLAPWIWYRLYGGPEPPGAGVERFAWGWLAGVAALAAGFLASAGVWARRNERSVRNLAKELEGNVENVVGSGRLIPGD
jgi:hypothetical protein